MGGVIFIQYGLALYNVFMFNFVTILLREYRETYFKFKLLTAYERLKIFESKNDVKTEIITNQ